MPPLAATKVCVFDAYGTLFNVHSAASAKRARLGPFADALSESWRSRQLQYTWLRALMGQYVNFWHVTEQALDYAMETVKLDDRALRQELLDLYRQLKAYPEVEPMLESLRARGRKTAILSNGSPTMLANAVDAAGLRERLDAVLSADSVKTFKPDPRVYNLTIEAFECEPAEVAFVTANSWDAFGAAGFGYAVIWLNRMSAPEERLPGQLAAQVKSLADVAPLFA
ncbi:MAG: haloacid dehalogenase type II [Myxococcota bacterium]